MKPIYLALGLLLFFVSCSKKENWRPQSGYPQNAMNVTIDDKDTQLELTGTLYKQKNGTCLLGIRAFNNDRLYIYLFYSGITLEQTDHRIMKVSEHTPDTTYAVYKPNDSDSTVYYANDGWLSFHSMENGVVKGSFYFTTSSEKGKYIKGLFSFKPEISEE